jgi:hypothetical protein
VALGEEKKKKRTSLAHEDSSKQDESVHHSFSTHAASRLWQMVGGGLATDSLIAASSRDGHLAFSLVAVVKKKLSRDPLCQGCFLHYDSLWRGIAMKTEEMPIRTSEVLCSSLSLTLIVSHP